nr:integrase, catalytic region, zinc finger, CCHC-type, peptidase aspartic, catalytic [Tanacetum cinerariifolium]
TAQTLPSNKKSILKNTNVLAPRMYKLQTNHNQARTSQLPQDSRKTNKRVSFSTGVILTTSVSRPQLKSNPIGDRVMRNNSQGKKQEVEDQSRNVKLPKNKMSILPANKKSILKNTNVLNPGMYKIHTDHTQTRTSKLPPDSRKTNKRVTFSTGVILSTSVSRPQLKSNPMKDRVLRNNSQGKKQEVEDHRRNVKLPKNKTSVTACNDSLNAKTLNVKSVSMCDKCVPLCQILHCLLTLLQLVEIVLFIVYSGCSKHMTRNLKLLINFVEKFLGTAKFGNDQIAPILGYGDLVQGAITIKRVYYVEGLNHNLFHWSIL